MARPRRTDRDTSEEMMERGCTIALLKLAGGVVGAIVAILNDNSDWSDGVGLQER